MTLLLIVGILFSCKEKKDTIAEKEVIENISALEFKTFIDANAVQLVDVRTPEEFELGFIPSAKLINVKDTNFSLEVSKLDKSKPVFVYCRSGSRSAKATKIMDELGFTKIYNLEGGFKAWQEKGHDISAHK